MAAATWVPSAGTGGPGRDLGTILRDYRQLSGMTQQHLADMLGFDRTYISMMERGRRGVTDRGTLAHIARTLAIPPYVLGIADPGNASHKAMLAFGASVIRLADLARHGGHTEDAVHELWPLITRLEALAAAGLADLELMKLLAQARLSFGVALGHLLPEERLATAACRTGRALRIAWDLADRELLASVLRMHGNELRKAGHVAAGIIRLRQSLQIDGELARSGSGLVLLARAAADSGQADLFDATSQECAHLLSARNRPEVLFNAFTFREVRLRGLLATGRPGQAADLAEHLATDEEAPTPQWRVIERITTADVLASAGEASTAATMLVRAVRDSEMLRLPHQVQRIIRVAEQPSICSADQHLTQQAQAALLRLGRQLSEASALPGYVLASLRAASATDRAGHVVADIQRAVRARRCVDGTAPADAVRSLEPADQGDCRHQRVLGAVPGQPQDRRSAGRLSVPRPVHCEDRAA